MNSHQPCLPVLSSPPEQSWDPMGAQRQQSWDLEAQQPWELTPLTIDINTSPRQEWRRWDDDWMRYADAMRLCDYPVDMQRDYFLYALGVAGRATLDTLGLNPDEQLNLPLVRDRLAVHFERALLTRRFHFNRVHQGYYLTFEEFLDKLMNQSNGLEYGSMREELVRDRLIAGLQNRDTQNRLLQEPHLTLLRAIDICRSRVSSEEKQRMNRSYSDRRAMRFNRMLNEARREFKEYRNASSQKLIQLKSTPPIEIKDDIDRTLKSVTIKKEVHTKCIDIEEKCEDNKGDNCIDKDDVIHEDIVIKKEPEALIETELIQPRIKLEPPEQSIDECIQDLKEVLGHKST